MKQCDKKSLLTLCLGAAGMSLRLLQNMTGFEPGTGLPIPGSIPGILLPVLLALSAVMLFRMNSKLPKGPVEVPLSRLLNWNDKEGLFGILAGGCVMALSGVLESPMRLEERLRRYLRTAWRSLQPALGPAAPVW